jgi:arylsulfatase A-like enzyme
VRFIQLYDTNWDHHGGVTENLQKHLPMKAKDIDQACAALVRDLKSRGLLDDTIVVWGGEFGRTPMGEVREFTGRNHHIDAFTMWFAGGGFRPGMTYGETDEFGFGAVKDPVHVRDIHATLLHQMGLNHERLSVRSQGLDVRLTGVNPAKVLKPLLA